jgi:hypothetical protein
MDALTGIMIGIITITIIVLVILGISFLSQLYKTIKENAEGAIKNVKKEKQLYCPHCGSNKTNRTTDTRRMVIVQLPDVSIKCTCFYCNNCSRHWFMELDTHERDDQHWCESETKWMPDVDE